MPGSKAILVLHGISMSGASMLRTLGPLAERLEALGFELVAPNGAHSLTSDELAGLARWMSEKYEKRGQQASDEFSEGRFWNAGEHYDWLQSETDPKTSKKTYRALERSLESIASAIQGRNVVGVLGFSQGAAMALVLSARALAGDPRFVGLRWGIFLSGFKPVFEGPLGVQYPLVGRFPALFGIGELDPVFPGNAEYLSALGQAFADGPHEQLVFSGLSHDLPSRPDDLQRLVDFATSH